MKEKEIVDFNKNNVDTALSKKGYGYTYFAKRDFKKGEEIMRVGDNKIINHQTAHCSMQIDVNKHFIPKKWSGRYLNHSCDPNTYMQTRKDGFPSLFALKNIKKGEEINYNYAMSEYTWIKSADENFVKCLCKTKKCRGRILSFSQLTTKDKNFLRKSKICSKYLMNSDIDNFSKLPFFKLKSYKKNILLSK